MARRKRTIPQLERLALKASLLMPLGKRDECRRQRVPAGRVIELYLNDQMQEVAARFNAGPPVQHHMHHIDPHVLGGANKWWNLDLLTPEQHRARKDQTRIAKVRRTRKKLGRIGRVRERGR